VPRRRAEDLPYAAIVLRRLLRASGVRRVVFSANGLREGWYMAHIPEAVRAQEPVLALCQDVARRLSRDAGLPPALVAWTTPLFPGETAEQRRLREAACWVSDRGIRDHPEYRAEGVFQRMLRQPDVALDHPARAFLALTLAMRYEADPAAPYLAPARALLDPSENRRAEALGAALRLAYILSAGTQQLLGLTALRREAGRLALSLAPRDGVFAGEPVRRQLQRVGSVLGLAATIEEPFAVAS